jgi:CheY-like chemotaxis protein/HPt (histidine-containing phosphotransfer) domain-containing protein
LRILLAEDTPDGAALTRALLRDTGCEIVIAATGAEAVDRFLESPVDLVLMDLQMPLMDGVEATRAIRRYETEMGRGRTPIVGLTASADLVSRRACLAAGCDAHLVKPIERTALVAAIERHTGGSPLPGRADPELASLVPDYLDRRRADLRHLRQALQTRDFAQIRRLGHGMKGSGQAFGFDAVAQIGRELERAAESHDGRQVAAMLTKLDSELNGVAREGPSPTGTRTG